MIPPDAFPYNNEIIYQDFAPLEYDSGNYEPALDKALDAIGYESFSRTSSRGCARKAATSASAIACYVEGTGIGPYEGAKVQVQANGKVSVATGIGTQGQGHFTGFAQIAADQLGVDVTQRRRGDRRHRPVLLGRRHLRQPRRGGRRQRRQRSGQGRAPEDPAARRRACSNAPRKIW